jgi:hypothetical protein
MVDDREIVGVLSRFPSVISASVRDPSVGDHEYADLVMYIEVRPFDDAVAGEIRRALSPLLGESVDGVHVQSADHAHAKLMVGTREIWRR